MSLIGTKSTKYLLKLWPATHDGLFITPHLDTWITLTRPQISVPTTHFECGDTSMHPLLETTPSTLLVEICPSWSWPKMLRNGTRRKPSSRREEELKDIIMTSKIVSCTVFSFRFMSFWLMHNHAICSTMHIPILDYLMCINVTKIWLKCQPYSINSKS